MLQEKIEVHGHWWLAEASDRRIAGTLLLTPERFSLTLQDALHGPTEIEAGVSDLWESVTVPRIFGTAEDGRTEFTLLECSGLKSIAPFSTVTETWRPAGVLIGDQVEGTGEVLFSRVSIGLDHLEEWVGGPRVDRKVVSDPESRLVEQVYASADRATLHSASLEGAKIDIMVFPKFELSERAAEIQLVTSIEVEVSSPCPWRKLLGDWIAPLRDLVALGVSAPTVITWLRVTPLTESPQDASSVELRYQTSEKTPSEPRYSFEMPMRVSELPDGFEAGLRRWWEIRQRHTHTIRALGGLLHAPFTYLEGRFVAVVRAAEAFHAVEFPDVVDAASEHAARVNGVLEATADLTADDRAWLESVLESSQAPVARYRILGLLNDLPEVGSLVSGGDMDRFARAITQTRNAITHPQSRPGSQALFDTEARYWHSEALLWLLRGLLLKGLGFVPQDVAQRLGRSPRYQHLVDLMGQRVRDAR